MAEAIRCDMCGKEPAHRVEVGVVMYNVVLADQPTGFSEAADLCEECQEPGMQTIFDHARQTLREQVPLHRDIYDLNREIEVQQSALSELAPLFQAHGDAGTKPTDVLLVKQDSISKALTEALVARDDKVAEATGLSDKGNDSLKRALARPKKK